MDGLSTTEMKEIELLYEKGVHLGHKKNRLHPKAKKFVYRMEHGVSIIDLTQTAKQLTAAKEYLAKLGRDSKVVLAVGTKRIVNQRLEELCATHNIPYITNKWLAGLITNFQTIHKNVQKLIKLKEDRATGAWAQYVKHEQTKLAKTITKLEKFYRGLVLLEKKPDVIFIVDIKKEKNAYAEAKRIGIPVVAIVDTNSNPEGVDFPIIANDDSPASVEYLVTEIIEAYAKAKTNSNGKAEIKKQAQGTKSQ